MPIETDGFTKDPAGPGGDGSAPAGTGFVKVTDGAYDTPGPLSADDITAAVQDLQTTASPQFAGINLGHASDTTLARSSAGVVTIEGVTISTASNTLTLSNKTLTAPKLADGGFIADANGNEGLILTTTASAVNEVTLANAATGGNPKLSATGGDTNIGLDLQTKGTGVFRLLGNSAQQAELRLFEDTDNGSNYIGLKPPASVASNITFTLPPSTGAGKVLTDLAGDGVLTMETVSATDTSALALDGSRTMTGAVNMGSGSKAFWSASGTLSSTQYEATRTAGGTLFINAPSAGDIEIGNAGSGKLNVSSAGVKVLGTGGTGHFLRQTSSNGVISSAALTPSDMPSQVAKYSRATSAQGSLSGSYAKNTVALNSVDANPNSNWSFSGGVATCVNAGVYDLVAQLYYSSTEGFFIINHNGNAIGGYYYSSGASGLWGQISVLGVSVGVGDTIEIDFFSSVAGGTIGNTYTGISVNAADKHATWLRLARRQ